VYLDIFFFEVVFMSLCYEGVWETYWYLLTFRWHTAFCRQKWKLPRYVRISLMALMTGC